MDLRSIQTQKFCPDFFHRYSFRFCDSWTLQSMGKVIPTTYPTSPSFHSPGKTPGLKEQMLGSSPLEFFQHLYGMTCELHALKQTRYPKTF
ncbi:hypothetical protein JTE90_008416 [Oedothorax gibbosus]|uniref:Uncharacterized protein n=1 Tax=Oedothorax gibbosus TaxID=931172 RepID=A0AAV6TD10_9ARAC|nr:hypothetical protein JTE90_008416 [Oedothorax gibbosus]